MSGHPQHTVGEDFGDGRAFWEGRYAESDRIWSGEPNTALVREVAELPPGRALDLGCGEGADVVWLARQGWTVTGTDIAETALVRARGHAAEAGVADRTRFEQHVLGASFPEGTYDLVTASFLHSPDVSFPREAILRRAAEAVAPGGTLLVIGHAGLAPWETYEEGDPHLALHLPSPQEVLESLRLPEGEWDVLTAAEHDRVQHAPDGEAHHRRDNALKVRRHAA
ncbi:class I SAM-dependent methyltransferase [Streptomyces sp. NPDC058426]|uniref:class I SAM-dependent methyltransferase n=1 Tax=Streptomyces sp. NPDC058426 TaxID=3346493 RepID=UPI0036567E76